MHSEPKLANGISKKRSLLGHIFLFGCCVTSYPKFLGLRAPMHHWGSDMVELTCWLRVSRLWLRAGRVHSSWRSGLLTAGTSVDLGGCSPPLLQALPSSASRDPLNLCLFLQNLCPPPALRVHVTRPNPRHKSLLEVPWPEELWTLAGSGDQHRERKRASAYCLPPHGQGVTCISRCSCSVVSTLLCILSEYRHGFSSYLGSFCILKLFF